jgi:hypothetical protein
MTKRHLKMLAATLRADRPDGNAPCLPVVTFTWKTIVEEIVEDIATTCGKFDPAFDRQKFLDECGVED